MSTSQQIASGARFIIRDAEWLVRRVDSTNESTNTLMVVGISELVCDHEAIFLDNLDMPEAIDLTKTKLVADDSPRYRRSLLYIESLLRQAPPTDEEIYIGQNAAMDPVPYQLEPELVRGPGI